MGLREMESRLPPGFRFYPSDEELVCFYLRKKVANERVSSGMTLIEVDLHAREPWELPVVAKLTADEWYFFSFRDKKYATGSRRNRATKMGYWKATGNDRTVHETGMATYGGLVGMRKTLVFYRGRAPNGHKTDWVMHEFRLEAPNSPPKEDWVLCRVFNKAKASQTEQGSKIKTNHTITGGTGIGPSSPTAVSLGSSPDPSAVDKFDGRHQPIAAEAAMGSSNSSSDTPVPLMHGDHHTGGSSCATLDLAMLQYYSLLEEYCADPAMHDGTVAVGANYTSCSAGSDRYINDGMVERELGLGRVGFRDHGMGDIEMKMEVQAGGSGYKDELHYEYS